MQFVAIPVDLIPYAWPQIRLGIDKALKQGMGMHTPGDVYDMCSSGDWMLFCMYEKNEPVVSLVAAIRARDSGPLFDIGLCWGTRMQEWKDEIYTALETIATQAKCVHIAFNGRPGWSKLARQHGFEVNTMIFTKELQT